MKFGLVFDSETTGLIDYHNPSDGEQQPHMVQLAAKLVDLDTREKLGEMNELIKPDGWEWDETSKAFEAHGITVEYATEHGINEIEAVHMFFALWEKGGDEIIRIGHNESFDRRIIRIATKRYPDLNHYMDPWHDLAKDRSFCTMWKSINIVKAPMTAKQIAAKVRGKYKQPTLSESYKHFMGKELEGAHDAMVDVDACLAVYWGIQDAAEPN